VFVLQSGQPAVAPAARCASMAALGPGGAKREKEAVAGPEAVAGAKEVLAAPEGGKGEVGPPTAKGWRGGETEASWWCAACGGAA
jgi:hypothetical protein